MVNENNPTSNQGAGQQQTAATSRLAKAQELANKLRTGAGTVAGAAGTAGRTTVVMAQNAWGAATSSVTMVIVFFLITALLHIFIVTNNPPIWLVFFSYFIVSILSILMLFRQEGFKIDVTYPLPWILSAAQIGLLTFTAIQIKFPVLATILDSQTLNALIVFLPIWPTYLILTSAPNWIRIPIILIVAIPLTLSLMTAIVTDFGFGPGALPTRIDITLAQQGFQQWYQENIESIPTNWNNLLNATITSWNRRLDFATGGYYSASQEQPKEKWGVFIEKIEKAQPRFILGEEVLVWANVKAKTPDFEKEIKVIMGCEVKKGKEFIKDVTPKPSLITVVNYGEEFVECTVTPKGTGTYNMSIGTYNIKMTAEYKFTTTSDLQVSYMDWYKKRELDPRKESSIAQSSSGPVQLAIGTQSQNEMPIGIRKDASTFVGLTIENKGDGRVKKVNALYLKIPEGLKPQKERCALVETSEEQGYNYKYSKEIIGEITDFRTIYCPLAVEDYKTLLHGAVTTPAIAHFKAMVDYVYVAEQSTSVLVEVPEGEQGASGEEGTSGAASKTDSAYPTTGPNSFAGPLVKSCVLGEYVEKFRITRYYAPYEGNFDRWADPGIPIDSRDTDQVLWACNHQNGFYEAVKCQGSGIGLNDELYRFKTIKPDKASSPSYPVGSPEYDDFMTKLAGRTVAINNEAPDQKLSRDDKIFLDFGSNVFTGVYYVEDAGGGEANWIDVYVGYGKLSELPSPPSNSADKQSYAHVYRCAS